MFNLTKRLLVYLYHTRTNIIVVSVGLIQIVQLVLVPFKIAIQLRLLNLMCWVLVHTDPHLVDNGSLTESIPECVLTLKTA